MYNEGMPFTKGYKPWNKKDQLTEQTLCACGCGLKMNKYDPRNRVRKYAYGHGNKGRKFNIKHDKQFKKGQSPWNKGVHVENSGTYKKGHIGMRGEQNPNWRGGHVMRNGYRAKTVNGKRVYIHRHVMQEKLGRKLLSTEHVHHINHDKLDNRPDNLTVLSPAEHAKYHATTMWAKYNT